MANPVEALSIHPLFYDALSGEFNPPTDPLNRTHTLGRLAYASFLKGTEITGPVGRDIDEGYGEQTAFAYEPTWTGGAKAQVHCNVANFGGSDRFDIMGIAIWPSYDRDEERLSIFRPNIDREKLTMVISTGESTMDTVQLELGQDLDLIRRHVAQVAQEFFDRLK